MMHKTLFAMVLFLQPISSTAVSAQDLSDFRDCAVMSVTTTFQSSGLGGGSRQAEVFMVPGLGSAFGNQFYFSQLPPGHQNARNFVCVHRHTRPVTNGQLQTLLDQHLANVNASLAATTTEVQQTIARSFAIQLDVIADEILEIRAQLSGLPTNQAEQISLRLDSLEARLDAIQGPGE